MRASQAVQCLQEIVYCVTPNDAINHTVKGCLGCIMQYSFAPNKSRIVFRFGDNSRMALSIEGVKFSAILL